MTSMKALVGALNKDEALIGIFPNYCELQMYIDVTIIK